MYIQFGKKFAHKMEVEEGMKGLKCKKLPVYFKIGVIIITEDT